MYLFTRCFSLEKLYGKNQSYQPILLRVVLIGKNDSEWNISHSRTSISRLLMYIILLLYFVQGEAKSHSLYPRIFIMFVYIVVVVVAVVVSLP